MGEVVELNLWTQHNAVDPDAVLEGNKGKFERFLLLGIEKGTGRFVAATTHTHLADCEHLAQKFIHKCHDGSYS